MDDLKTVADVRRMLKSLAHVDAYDLAAAQLHPEDTEPEAHQVANVEFLRAAGYDVMNVGEAIDYIAGLSDTEREIALEYERRNRNRSTLLTEFE